MIYYGKELYHFGIKGQKWGERNYQNKDGSLTPAGVARYRNAFSGRALGNSIKSKYAGVERRVSSALAKATGSKSLKKNADEWGAIERSSAKKAANAQQEANARRDAKDYGGQKAASRAKKAAAIGAAAVATALAGYGVYKAATGKGGTAALPMKGSSQALKALTMKNMPPAVISSGKNAVGSVLRSSNSLARTGLNEVVVDRRPAQIAAIAGGAAAAAGGLAAARRTRRNSNREQQR